MILCSGYFLIGMLVYSAYVVAFDVKDNILKTMASITAE